MPLYQLVYLSYAYPSSPGLRLPVRREQLMELKTFIPQIRKDLVPIRSEKKSIALIVDPIHN